MTIELTDDEMSQLILMCGYATGAAERNGDRRLALSYLRLANRINENNPQWTPYAIPEEKN